MRLFTRERVAAKPPAVFTPRRRERRNIVERERLVQRVTGEFREMPDLRITAGEAQRLFALRSDVCARLIETLLCKGVLRRDADGRYATV